MTATPEQGVLRPYQQNEADQAEDERDAQAGGHLCAARVPANDMIVEHKAYWAPVKSASEASYLIAILNSDGVSTKIAPLQSHGEAGTRRDLDNLVWTLPIPEYDDANQVHRDLAAAAERAELVAATVALSDKQHFTTKRRVIRAALAADGVTRNIDALVDAILPP